MSPANNSGSSKQVNDISRATKQQESIEQPPMKQPTKTSRKKTPSSLILPFVLFLALVASGAYIMTLRSDIDDLQNKAAVVAQNPQAAVEQQTKTQIDKVGQLMQLPADEQPTVANVSDAEQAKKQSAFFNSAQNGDTVLMYVKSGQAILYRPSTNRIVLVAPLSFDQPAATSTTKR